jgi:hypothetical protein
MSALGKFAIILLGTVATGVYLAVPAGADPGFDPCRATFIPICRMLPTMPDLDHDVDLTQNPNGLIDGQDGQIGGDQPGAGQNGGASQNGNQPSTGQNGGASQSGNQPSTGQNGGASQNANQPSTGQNGGAGQSGG